MKMGRVGWVCSVLIPGMLAVTASCGGIAIDEPSGGSTDESHGGSDRTKGVIGSDGDGGGGDSTSHGMGRDPSRGRAHDSAGSDGRGDSPSQCDCREEESCVEGKCVVRECSPEQQFCDGDSDGDGDGLPRSCEDLPDTCGPSGDESCCTSLLVPGGTYDRINDPLYPATVSDFRLDKYEVTVGRFRRFVDAMVSGWRPESGDGKHAHLNSGDGLSNSHTDSAHELGWDTAWDVANSSYGMHSDKTDWDSSLSCGVTAPFDYTWTPTPGDNENRPINCVNWFQAYAFCIYDGGFLPSEAEWNYAAAGGSEQRQYPWSDPPSSETITCDHAYYSGGGTCSGVFLAEVGSFPTGNGRWGQSDLAGNIREWTLDGWGWGTEGFLVPCHDCSFLPNSPYQGNRVVRSLSLFATPTTLLSSFRFNDHAQHRGSGLGMRCARKPSTN